ncbi:MAG: zinc ribbon domain-containing protein [Thermoguttaceae bacterium]
MPSYDSLMSVLRTLHRLQTQLGDLQGRLAKWPRLVAAQNAKVAQLEKQRAALTAEHQNLVLNAKDKERQMVAAEQSIAKRKQQLNEAKTNKEYQALQSQIAHDEATNATMADAVLEAMEAAETFLPRVKAVEEELRQETARRDTLVKQGEAEKPSIEEDIVRVTGELRGEEPNLPRPFRDIYIRLQQTRGETSLLAEITQQKFCGECNNQLAINQLAQMMQQQPITCSSCARLLFLPEGYVFDRG